MIEKRLKTLGVLGIISLLSYTAMVVFSPLAYLGYDWLSMAVSDLSAEGVPSQALANQLNALYGPCGLVSIMAVCVGVAGCRSKALKAGIYCFAAMEWVCSVGYTLDGNKLLASMTNDFDGTDMTMELTVEKDGNQLLLTMDYKDLTLCWSWGEGETGKGVES